MIIGENGDILTRYRIPHINNKADYTLQLPEDSDSSASTSEEEAVADVDGVDASKENDGGKDDDEEKKDNQHQDDTKK